MTGDDREHQGPPRVERLGPGDDAAVLRASALFDSPAQLRATQRFLAIPEHHLLIVYIGEEPAGFVTGIEMTHPDKGTEMFLYELGVDDAFRGRGLGVVLVRALRDLARERECYGMWVLTDADNHAALATYRAGGAGAPSSQVMLSWSFE